MSEPKTIEDLRYMRETSERWFDAKIKHENLRDHSKDYVEGELDSRSVHAYCSKYEGGVRVVEREHYVSDVKGPRSCSLRCEDRTIAVYTFDEFRKSEWWPLTMQAWDGGCTDASVLGIEFEQDDSYTYTEVRSPRRYTDWLGNFRIDKEVDVSSVSIDEDAQLTLRFNGATWDGTMEEAMALLSEAQAFRDAGVKLEDGELTVKMEDADGQD